MARLDRHADDALASIVRWGLFDDLIGAAKQYHHEHAERCPAIVRVRQRFARVLTS
jgi:hypothetical protein